MRISKIEIIGKNLMNRNNNVKKNPIVPTNMDQSHIVGWYKPHDEGRKSLCKLVTTITNRSSHIPILTMNDMIQRATRFDLIFLDHKNCGVTMLQRIKDQ